MGAPHELATGVGGKMTNRREFIQHGVALSAAPFVLGPAVGTTAQTERMQPVLVVFDRQYSESRLFASALEARGFPTHGIAGDVTSLWYDDLYHRWAGGPSPIVGLTGASSLFCLEHLAWKVERRVVFRAEHRQLGNARVEHRLTGPEPLPLSSRIEASWPLWSASAVQSLPARLRRGVRFDAQAVGSAISESGAWEEPLVTWAIALKPAA
jgi:hypothetical protein